MIVVTGATGNVGQPLVRALVAAGEQVTAVSRRAAEVPPGATHRRADLAESESLKPVFDGAEALFLLAAGEDPEGVVAAARAGGVGRIVLLSSQGAGTRPESYPHPRAFEDAVRRSGLDWTILRPGGFQSNAFGWAEAVRSLRTVFAPFGEVALPFIDPADVAEVGAVALRAPGHAGRTYELTGPAASTPRRRAEEIGDALGEPVRFVEQSAAEAEEQLLALLPAVVAAGTLAILGEPTSAERRVSPDVERVLGRSPGAFAEWAVRNVVAFR